MGYVAANISDPKVQNEICIPTSHPTTINEYMISEYNGNKSFKSLEDHGCGKFLQSRLFFLRGVPVWKLLWHIFGRSWVWEISSKSFILFKRCSRVEITLAYFW